MNTPEYDYERLSINPADLLPPANETPLEKREREIAYLLHHFERLTFEVELICLGAGLSQQTPAAALLNIQKKTIATRALVNKFLNNTTSGNEPS